MSVFARLCSEIQCMNDKIDKLESRIGIIEEINVSNLTITGTLCVMDTATFESDVNISGTLYADTIDVVGPFTLNVYGNSNLNNLSTNGVTEINTLNASGTSTFDTIVTFNDNIIFEPTEVCEDIPISPSGAYYQLTGDRLNDNDKFGSQIVVSNDGKYLLVGAESDANTGAQDANHTGIVYIYNFTGGSWTRVSKLEPSDASPTTPGGVVLFTGTQNFGSSISISNDNSIIVVGSVSKEINGNKFVGSAYIFEHTGSNDSHEWVENSIITGPNDNNNEIILFGLSSDISTNNDLIAIGSAYPGSEFKSDATGANGRVYLLQKSGEKWSIFDSLQLEESKSKDLDFFGRKILFNSDSTKLYIGAPGGFGVYNPNMTGGGNVYEYEYVDNSWNNISVINLPNDEINIDNNFGTSMVLSNDDRYLLVGAPNNLGSTSPDLTGKAYLFENTGSGWKKTMNFEPSNATGDNQFGFSLDMSDDAKNIVIGAPSNGSESGTVYLYTKFENDGKYIEAKLTGPGTVSYGVSTHISKTSSVKNIDLIVGASNSGVSFFIVSPGKFGDVFVYDNLQISEESCELLDTYLSADNINVNTGSVNNTYLSDKFIVNDSNYSLSLPDDCGNTGQCLCVDTVVDNNANLSWKNVLGGSLILTGTGPNGPVDNLLINVNGTNYKIALYD